MNIFDELAAKHGLDFNLPGRSPVEASQVLPVIRRDPGENDHLIKRTDNGLRPDDLMLDQPSQDPGWRP